MEEDFEDSRLAEPMECLRKYGAEVAIVGPSRLAYRGKWGPVSVSADATADQVRAEDLDAVVVPGCYAPDKMRLSESMVELTKQACIHGKVVAANCHGPQLLISADVVRGRRVTSWPSVAVDLKNAGAQCLDQPVVQDGNLITSRKPADIQEFNHAILRAPTEVPARA